VAISRAVVLDAADQPVPRRVVGPEDVAAEHQRLQQALEASAHDIEGLIEKTAAELGTETAKIFAFHLQMLQDQHLLGQIEQMMDRERVTAEYAVYAVMRRQARQFADIDNRYFRDRVKDVWDIERRVLGHLIGRRRENLSHLRHNAVVIAHDLTPSQTASLDKERIKGIATDAGGQTSHTAILAHALAIPAIVGLEDVTGQVSSGDMVILDGNRGLVIIDPDADQLMEYREYLARIAEFETSLDKLSRQPAVTSDGVEITLWANIEFPGEIAAALQKGATGIGLYRTEFLFLAAGAAVSEEQQYEAYAQAVRAAAGQPLTIRTLDLGADKLLGTDDERHVEPNPFLGCRSIRLCLQNLPLFKTQLRAILRASALGPVRVMFPLISNVMELRQAKMVLSDVREDLEEEGEEFDRDVPVGMMIEVPSAALQAKLFCREVDFMSIGTNDLIQYTVAVDRSNERIASLYSGAHPSVLMLIRDVVRAANRAKVDVSLCGEMAGEPEFIMLLLGLGLRRLSITPPAIPEVKKVVRSVSLAQCQRVARRCLGMDSGREVHSCLREELRRIIPEVFV
jgi:phosphotransferase system enzyme I (PtsI)